MANVGPLTWYVRDNAPASTVGWSAVTPWAASSAVAVGALRRQLATPAVNNERVFVCIVAGTTGASEPAWVITQGAKTVSNTATFMECTGQPAINGERPVSIAIGASPITTITAITLLVSSTAGVSVGMYVTEPVAHTYMKAAANSAVVTAVVANTSITLKALGVSNTTIPAGTIFSFGNSPFWITQYSSGAPALGYVIYDPNTASLQIVTTSALQSTTQPSFSVTAGVITSDGATLKWTSLGLASNFGSWAAPHARLQNALAYTWSVAGNTIYLGDDHAETQTTEIDLEGQGTGPSPCFVYCIDHTTTLPPNSTNLKTTASITCLDSANVVQIYQWLYFYGVIFKSACTTGQAINVIAANPGTIRLDACSMQLTAGSGNAQIVFGGDGGWAELILNNTTVSFSAAAQNIIPNYCRVIWKNTLSAVLGSVPTTLFSNNGVPGMIVLDGVDLSAVTTTLFAEQSGPLYVQLTDCKLAPSVIISAVQDSGGAVIDVVRSDSAATIYQAQRYSFAGIQVPSTIIVRTNGASDGITAISYAITTKAASSWLFPYQAFPIAIWNAVTGSTVTCTVRGVWNAVALPNNDQIWLDVEYLGSAYAPLASFATGSKANNLATGTALTADTSAWDSQATARANSTVYALGAITKLASNPGRLFFCTTAGTSAASEPAGYATAVDGGSVTDGTAVLRAGVRFAMVVALSSPTPAMAGDLYATIRAALPSSTFWVDPLIVLS